jgi:DNA-directed RNA polymerase alpha subunit
MKKRPPPMRTYEEVMRLDAPIEAINPLLRADVATIGDLLGYSERELLEFPGLGKRRVASLKKALAEYGYSLRMEV